MPRFAAESEGAALRVGLVGAGGISHVHVAGWQALGADISVFSKAGADALAEQHGLTVVSTFEELVDLVDVVDIVTPTATHRELALTAIAAGRHVVCEKPLAATSAEAKEIARAARAAGVQVYPAHVVRYFPEYVALKRAITTGVIGEPAVLRFTRAGEAPRAGSWFFDETAGGGIVLDQMIHDLDQARWLAGEVVQVYAVQNPPTREGTVPAVVTAQIVLTHLSGAVSHVQGYWGPTGLTFRTSVDVAGSAGTVGYESPDDGSIRMDMPAATSADDYLPPRTHAESPYTLELREFAAAFAGGPVPRIDLEDGILAIALAEAAVASIASGAAVDFNADVVLADLQEVVA
ncbi:MAG: hypothetical protein BGN97_12825 [Microbacterium sp. 69-10]|uniref:Gfo/Idh/MocA family protein n=1 Tax=Microbacterium sp. 69-10 TaxID=1895783 RepID=UPI00096621AE|nr:Gfo/Idh/MocA family oxidoreductase [Microbacterium sp. 69-10]OJU39038.1 MAG: hypothetical protein BGN97_12825 [Microbacterium sp. 69-10]